MPTADSSQPGPATASGAGASPAPAHRVAGHASAEVGRTPAIWPGASNVPPVHEGIPSHRVIRRRVPWEWGVAVSGALAIHGSLLLFGESEPARDVKPPLENDYVMIEMPVLEPPEMIEVVETGESSAPPEMAPPTLLDVPNTVAVADFMQPMQPQLDPSLTSVSAITIPKMTGNFGQPGTPGVKLFDLRDLDRVPRRTRTVMPVYPFELRRAGVTGEVILLVIIDPSGHVEVEQVLSATNREFEAAAVKAAEQCMFESPLKGGQKVSARYTWRIPFELQ